MKTLTNRTFQIFRRVPDGSKGYATLTSPNTYISTSKFPKRLLQAQKPHCFQVGDVVRAPSGAIVLLMEFVNMINGVESFVAAHVNTVRIWKRPTVAIDPVSMLPTAAGETAMGTIYLTQDQLEDLTAEGMKVDQFGFYTGQDVRVGDKIGDKKVTDIREALGVKYVTIK